MNIGKECIPVKGKYISLLTLKIFEGYFIFMTTPVYPYLINLIVDKPFGFRH